MSDPVEAGAGRPRSQDAGRFKRAGPVCVVALGTLVGEVVILVLLGRLAVTPVSAAVAHLAVVAALAVWVRRLARRQEDFRLPLLLAATTAVLGPLGAIGTLLTWALSVVYARSATPFEEWYESMFPENESKFSAYLFEQLRAHHGDPGEQTGVAPFTDILSFGTQQQKQIAIALIADRFQPAFAPALRQALHDNSSVIRVHAAAAITKIEKDFLARRLELSTAVQERPRDPEALRELARHHDDYAYTGIMDGEREQENRKKALEAYRDYLKLQPDDANAQCLIGRILLRAGAFREAGEWLEQSIRQGSSLPQTILWYMESLFHLGRFPELRELAHAHYADLAADDRIPDQALRAVELWAGKVAEESGVTPLES